MEPRIRVSAILRWRGSVLLCRHEKGGHEHWLLPGGGVNSGESLVDALHRELAEEVGIRDEVPVEGPVAIVDSISPVRSFAAKHVVHIIFAGDLGGRSLEAVTSHDAAVRGHRLFGGNELDGIVLHPPIQVFLHRYFRPGDCVYDPFVGSGTTLVEANAFGAAAVGCDISAFNCLLTRVKTTAYSLGTLELELRGVLEQSRHTSEVVTTADASDWLRSWYFERALSELLAYHCVASESLDDPGWDVARVILSRAARSARRTTHFDLDFPRRPVKRPYWCHKHKRTCRPVGEAMKFLRRYTGDTVRRIREFAEVRSDQPVEVIHGDARTVDLPLEPSGIITSPPYPGLIDYHEQHRYAYELLGLEDRREDEIGPASRGQSQAAVRAYVENIVAAFT